jgi:hypothetical protein
MLSRLIWRICGWRRGTGQGGHFGLRVGSVLRGFARARHIAQSPVAAMRDDNVS